MRNLEKDPANEKIRFRLKKAINVPVNAIGCVSAAHFTDKYDRLFNLLSGKPVQVDNDQIVASDPLVNTYCKKLLAEKFVVRSYTLGYIDPFVLGSGVLIIED